MRRVMWYSEAKFGHAELSYWNDTLRCLATLPSRELDIGAEARFSTWLGEARAEFIRQVTDDELSRFLSGTPSAFDIFQQRAPSEILFQWGTTRSSLHMTPTALESCASICSGIPDQRIRTFRNFSVPDARGGRQEFVIPAELPQAIDEFCSVWNSGSGVGRYPVPIWLFVALLNAHPFGDGNGRLARSLLNVFLVKNGLLRGHPIPFGPLLHATQGNFILAIGRAAIMTNWEPITKTFYLLIKFYADVYDEFWKENDG